MYRFRPRLEVIRAWAFCLGITPGIFGIFNQKWIKSGRFRWKIMVKIREKKGKTGAKRGRGGSWKQNWQKMGAENRMF